MRSNQQDGVFQCDFWKCLTWDVLGCRFFSLDFWWLHVFIDDEAFRIPSVRFQEFTNNFPEVFHKPFSWQRKTWTSPSRSDWTGWMSSSVVWPAIATMTVITTINVTWTSSSAGWACGAMLRCDFWNQMKSMQVPSTLVAVTFLEIWKMFSNIAWWTCAHVEVARLDQESECAQWISLAKHIVVKLTTSKAMTKRPSSILFHWSWQSRSRKSQQGLATTLFFIVFPKTLAKFW